MKNLIFSILLLLFCMVCFNSCNMQADPIEDLVLQENGGGSSGGGGGKEEPE